MKKNALFLVLTVLLLAAMACTVGGVAATSTPQPTETPQPSDTPEPLPTNTPEPTDMPEPTAEPKVTLAEYERALRDAGYTRANFSDGSGAVWTLDNVFENTYTYDNGWIQMDVLNSLKSRLDHMEAKFAIMDGLFPSDFMDELRAANEAYADTVGAGVTGKASNSYGPNPGDFWKYQSANYNISNQMVGDYEVQFALFFQQWTCPPEYICTFPNFGNREFSGQASFVFYEVSVKLDV